MMYRIANSNRSLVFATSLTLLSMPAVNALTCRLASTAAMLDVRIGYHLAAGNVDAAAALIQERRSSEHWHKS